MGTFLTILIIGFAVYLLVKGIEKSNVSSKPSSRRFANSFDIKLSKTDLSASDKIFQQEKFEPIKQDNNGFWILNPGAPFELTILTKDINIAHSIRDLIDDRNISGDKLLTLFVENNIKIKEIEEYKIKYQPEYLKTIEELKIKSKEWQLAYEKDKEDLLIGFRKTALKKIYERANCNLQILFEWDCTDYSLDIDLIKAYGFENIEAYIQARRFNEFQKIMRISNDKQQRPIFENLVKLGLADNGITFPKEEILNILSLKDLNDIAKNSDKEYKRKNQAIEYIMNLDNLDERIGKHVSLRELFKLKPLPDKFGSVDIEKIIEKWDYYYEVISLLRMTFSDSYYIYKELKDYKDIKNINIVPQPREDMCPCAKDLQKKKFAKYNLPKVPCHVGCDCSLNIEYIWE